MLDSLLHSAGVASLTIPLMVIAVFIYFIAGVVKGTLGIGFPMTAVSLLAQITDARTAIALVVVPMVVTNAWQVLRSGKVNWVVASFWRLILFMVLFIAIFSQFTTAVPVTVLTATLGLIVTFYAAISLYKPVLHIPHRFDAIAQLVAGISSGIMGGIAGIWAPPILIYLGARRVTKEQFVATTGLLLFLGSVVLFSGYWRSGIIGSAVFTISTMLLVPTMAGVLIGEWIRRKMSAQRFARALLWFFLLMGLSLIYKGFM